MDKKFIKVLNRDDMPPDTIKPVMVGKHEVALCREGDIFYALENRCTHKDRPLNDGCIFDGQLECPWHGARFDLKTGNALSLPAVRSVPTFDVELRGDEVWVCSTPKLHN
jgi:3-phenylpropionate/trans-cinnamate dioxygenase ferredoxin component